MRSFSELTSGQSFPDTPRSRETVIQSVTGFYKNQFNVHDLDLLLNKQHNGNEPSINQEDEVKMEHGGDIDAAINLSTNHLIRSTSVSRTLGVENVDSETEVSEDQLVSKAHTSSDNEMVDDEDRTSPLLSITSQFLAQHQMQQVLEREVLSPAQLHQLLQQQQLLFMQQLQFNMMQQSQLLHNLNSADSEEKTKKCGQQLQQLALQQEHLMQQLQLYHHFSIVGLPPFLSHSGLPGLENKWKNGSVSIKEESLKTRVNEVSHITSKSVSASQESVLSTLIPNHLLTKKDDECKLSNSTRTGVTDQTSSVFSSKEDGIWYPDHHFHPLFGNGVCKWPGCETVCEDFQAFIQHLNKEHYLDDRSTAQARVQMQVVSQLETQLTKERSRLQAMMTHLHKRTTANLPSPDSSTQDMTMPPISKLAPTSLQQLSLPITSISSSLGHLPPLIDPAISSPQPSPSSTSVSSTDLFTVALPTVTNSTPLMTDPLRLIPANPQSLHSSACNDVASVYWRHNEKGCLSMPGLRTPLANHSIRKRVSEKCKLDINEELRTNREFYKNVDFRPPFTYAVLIRQAIIESPEKQLTLNGIYCWFQNTFCYFRRNAPTWKNAVRHNLSLHKCFMRVENVKGAVWTVDESEFHRRRSTRIQEHIEDIPSTTTYNPSYSYLSPTLYHHPGLYGEHLTASLQAALAESNLTLFSNSISKEITLPCTPTSVSLAVSKVIKGDCYTTGMAQKKTVNGEIPNSHISSDALIKKELLLEDHPNGEDGSDNHQSLTLPHFNDEDSQSKIGKIEAKEAEDLSIAANA
ncbi:forkhead box protein P4-like isoform X2 [Tachypleus tridentatus]|uniref:forkhead box protein P4-like isoform X2 n=1 Tax=Tachypleus tridentatus TaxID=6853 RepID=UPI003FCFD29B